MFARTSATFLTTLLLLTTSTVQVNVILMMNRISAVTCTGLLPGQCCQSPMSVDPQTYRQTYLSYPIEIDIHSLLPRQIAGIFTGSDDRPGCSNMPPFKIQRGPGNFNFPDLRPFPITGVSYIVLPQGIEQDTTNNEILASQGLLGLRTAQQQWTAPGVSAAALFNGAASGALGSKFRRGIIRGESGTVYIGPPPRGRYPDLAVVNGVEYRSINTSALDFRDANGQLLNISTLGV